MQIYGYIAAIFMGLSLGLIGGGGSILTVPILVYLFLVDPLIATSDSLFIVGSTALIGGILASRREEVDFKNGILFFIPSLVGVLISKTYLLPAVPATILTLGGFSLTKPVLIMAFFAGLMLIASLKMIRQKNTVSENAQPKNNYMQITVQGFIVGCVTGIVGAGGGFLIVPALVNLVGLNMRKAIGTSLVIIAANSLLGFAASLYKGLVPDWTFLFSILLIAIIGLFVGSYFSKRVPEKKLKSGFGYFVLIMGALILIDQMRRL